MSYRYTFTGVIHPERAAVSMSTVSLAVQAPSGAIDGRLYVTIAVSQVTAVFESEQRVRELHTLKNYVTDAVRVAVDAFGYLTGRGYGVEIVQVVPAESTNPVVFGVDVPALENRAPDLNARFTEVMSLSGIHEAPISRDVLPIFVRPFGLRKTRGFSVTEQSRLCVSSS